MLCWCRRGGRKRCSVYVFVANENYFLLESCSSKIFFSLLLSASSVSSGHSKNIRRRRRRCLRCCCWLAPSLCAKRCPNCTTTYHAEWTSRKCINTRWIQWWLLHQHVREHLTLLQFNCCTAIYFSKKYGMRNPHKKINDRTTNKRKAHTHIQRARSTTLDKCLKTIFAMFSPSCSAHTHTKDASASATIERIPRKCRSK